MKKTLSPRSRDTALVVDVTGHDGTARFLHDFTIGRGPDNDLVIDDPCVSLRHAAVSLREGTWWLKDLGSTNGTLVNGQRIERVPIEPALQARLGYQGPAVRLQVEGTRPVTASETAVPSESAILRRYLGRRAPTSVGEVTAILRDVLRRAQRRRRRRYLIVLAVVTGLAAGAGGYAFYLHKEVERQRQVAAELFYRAKQLELDMAELQMNAPPETFQRASDLQEQYRVLVGELDIYGEDTPPEIRHVYRVAHRFGESEINVPPEFVEEVLRYVERWRTSTRLEDAMRRSRQAGYGPRIAEIMLEHGLPPDFFFLALQESSLRLEAVGPETRFGIAKGMWQIIPGTAREYGLSTGPLVGVARYDPRDQRHDFERSTRAAARYLKHIYTTDAQASGLLVIAAYNWGQTRLIRLIRSLPENPRDRNFWRLLTQYRDRIPRQTYDYVFNIVSAAVIAEDPELFGFDFEPPFERPAAPEVSAVPAVEAPDD